MERVVSGYGRGMDGFSDRRTLRLLWECEEMKSRGDGRKKLGGRMLVMKGREDVEDGVAFRHAPLHSLESLSSREAHRDSPSRPNVVELATAEASRFPLIAREQMFLGNHLHMHGFLRIKSRPRHIPLKSSPSFQTPSPNS
jgi:hypothetical protein